METGKPSQSAQFVAVSRAAHLYVDGEPKILEDKYALIFIGNEYEELFKTNEELFQNPQAKVVRSLTICRSRITEDLLEEAIEHGVKQYVILGAGLDSFAFRRPDLTKQLQIFEVDHPASQSWKINQLKQKNISFPENLSFVAIDFENQSLETELIKSNFKPEIPTFFSWLGVTQFIDEESVFMVLKYVASSASGSQVVFQYCLPDEILNPEEQQQRVWARQRADEIGEPWKSTFHTKYLTEKLIEMGFTEIEDIDKEKAETLLYKYFADRNDDLELTFGKGGTALMRAALNPNVA